jgi:hypothetical protein
MCRTLVIHEWPHCCTVHWEIVFVVTSRMSILLGSMLIHDGWLVDSTFCCIMDVSRALRWHVTDVSCVTLTCHGCLCRTLRWHATDVSVGRYVDMSRMSLSDVMLTCHGCLSDVTLTCHGCLCRTLRWHVTDLSCVTLTCHGCLCRTLRWHVTDVSCVTLTCHGCLCRTLRWHVADVSVGRYVDTSRMFLCCAHAAVCKTLST